MTVAAKHEPTDGLGCEPERDGMMVRPEEIVPGDQTRDHGVVRTISHIELPARRGGSAVVWFTPREGYPPNLFLACGFGIYVRRVHGEE
jgi:hypothetical protein